ncbi:MAG: PAS domain S-box protein [Promethearchaeota archaeon]
MMNERERFREIADNMPIAVLEFDPDFTLVYGNQKALEWLRMPKSRLSEKIPVHNLVAPEQVDLVYEGLEQLKKGQEPTSISLRVLRSDGVQLPTQVYTERILSNGNLAGFLVYLVDISRRTAVEEKLRERRNLLEYTVEHSSFSGILIVDDKFTIEYVNDKLTDLAGRRRSDLLGQDFRMLIHPDSIDLVAERYRKRQAGERVPSIYEFEILRPDGSSRNVAVYASTLAGEDGSVKTVAQLMDVTEEKEQRRLLEESERRWRRLVETMTAGLGIDDENGIITYTNKALTDMLGYEEDGLVGLPSHKILHGTTDEQQIERIVARRSGKVEQYETRLVTKSGGYIPAVVSATPIFNIEEKYIGSFAIFSNVSDLKAAEDEVRFLLDLLLHDIGNQLQLILAGGDMISKEAEPVDTQKAKQYILDGASRCIELITKVRKSDEAKAEPLSLIDLSPVLKHEIDLLRSQYNVKMEIMRIPDSVLVYADGALSQLIWNIMENAVKHNPNEEKTIWIAGHMKEDTFLLAFADDGPGLNRSKKDGLFDMARRFGGVGLHLVRRLAEKYNAKLKVQDRVKGKPSQGLKVSVEFMLALEGNTTVP